MAAFGKCDTHSLSFLLAHNNKRLYSSRLYTREQDIEGVSVPQISFLPSR